MYPVAISPDIIAKKIYTNIKNGLRRIKINATIANAVSPFMFDGNNPVQ